MGPIIAPALAYFRLQLRLDLIAGIENVAVGLAIPLVGAASCGQTLGLAARERLLVGLVLTAQTAIVLRRIGLVLASARFDGRMSLLRTTSLGPTSYWVAAAMNAAVLSTIPLAGLVAGASLFGVALPGAWVWAPPYALASGITFAFAVLLSAVPGDVFAIGVATDLTLIVNVAFCPLLYPLERAPGWLQPIVARLPLSIAADLMCGAKSGGGQVARLSGWFLAIGFGSLVALARVERQAA